jgi:ribosomal protein S18 acetylase RimI-like enzyme
VNEGGPAPERGSAIPGGESISYRAARRADLEAAVALMIRCDLLESGQAGTSLEDVQYEWGLLEPDRDIRLAFDRGQLVGYAAVFPWADRRRYDIHVDPSWRETELPQGLLHWCDERSGGEPESGRERVDTVAYVSHVDWQGAQALQDAGFEARRNHINLEMVLNDSMKAPQWPADVSVREFVVGSDDREVYELIQSSFDRPDRERQPYESWREFMMREGLLDPSLWFLAATRRETVGACLCFEYPGEGWVRQLGVAKEWRNRGIGGALLRHAFQVFWRRGFARVGLSVASDNPDAAQFYERLGMRSVRQYVEYVRPARH